MKLSLNKLGFAYCFYEDIEKNTARVLPNRFYPNSMLSGNTVVQLPSGGFKIKFDRPGRERVACIASDRELVVPSGISNSKDLSPLTLRSVEQVIGQFKNSNPIMTSSIVDISVQ